MLKFSGTFEFEGNGGKITFEDVNFGKILDEIESRKRAYTKLRSQAITEGISKNTATTEVLMKIVGDMENRRKETDERVVVLLEEFSKWQISASKVIKELQSQLKMLKEENTLVRALAEDTRNRVFGNDDPKVKEETRKVWNESES